MSDTLQLTTLAQGLVLVSWWKPILLLLPFVGWAWLVSTIFDKHAQRFYLGREKWSAIHMVFAAAALAGALLLPLGGFLGILVAFVLVTAILALDVVIFVAVANRDERVPETAHLKLDFSSMQEARAAKAAAKQMGTVSLTIAGPSKISVKPPEKDSPDYAVRVTAEEIVIDALTKRAHEVVIAPAKQNTYAIALTVDGVRQAGEPIPAQDAIAIIDFWKSCAELDVKDRRRKLVGRVTVGNEALQHELKLVTSGSQGGMKLEMVVDPAKSVQRPLRDLGLLDPQIEAVRSLAAENRGVVLLTAPPDNGRTTMLYAMVGLHDAYTSNVQTLEHEVEASLEGVRQVPFDPSAEGAEFSVQLRSMLRRDPDVVGVGELPDVDTAREVSRADLDRTRIYVSMRGDGALAAVQTWVKAVGDPKAAADGLTAVVAGKLIRKLCENCRVQYAPPPEMIKKLGLPADKVKQLYKKGGQVLIRNKPEVCPVCNGIGYFGQIGVFEVYPIGPEERKLIADGNLSGLRAAFRKSGLPSLQQAAILRAVEGATSVEEVTRITAPPKPPANRTEQKKKSA